MISRRGIPRVCPPPPHLTPLLLLSRGNVKNLQIHVDAWLFVQIQRVIVEGDSNRLDSCQDSPGDNLLLDRNFPKAVSQRQRVADNSSVHLQKPY